MKEEQLSIIPHTHTEKRKKGKVYILTKYWDKRMEGKNYRRKIKKRKKEQEKGTR